VPGGIMERPAPVPVSNVMVVCPTCGNPTRIGIAERETKDGTIRVRVCKREGCGEGLD
jgi:large subunit ribosomal protein L24